MNVQDDGPSTVVLAQAKPLVPGYLLTPFGWATQPLAALVQADPELLTHVFELDRVRMHVIALALAHLNGNPAPHLAPVLFRASIHEVLHRVVGRSPPGIRRVLRRLPFAVLIRQGYLRLIKLLDDPRSAKLLHHLDATAITDSTVRVLYEIPAVLRPILSESGASKGLKSSTNCRSVCGGSLRVVLLRVSTPWLPTWRPRPSRGNSSLG